MYLPVKPGRLIEDALYLHIFYFQIFIHISVNIIFKIRYMLIVKYIYD